MATQFQVLAADTAVELKAALSLNAGQEYTIQAQGNPVFYADLAAAPTPGTSYGTLLRPGVIYNIKPESANGAYVWSVGATALVVVNDEG